MREAEWELDGWRNGGETADAALARYKSNARQKQQRRRTYRRAEAVQAG